MRHLAMIMDGNRRFAKKNGLHNPYNTKSQDAIRNAITFCIKNKIEHLSLFAFSLENLHRSPQECSLVFSLLEQTLQTNMQPLINQGIRICFIGDRSLYPTSLIPLIEKVEKDSQNSSLLQLNILFCYGAQQELLAATKKLAQKVQRGTLLPEEITSEHLSRELWTSGIPNPELIIRTGDASRLSNFLLYQAAYSELAFLPCYWPEITEEHIQNCVNQFYETKRNFGK